MGSDIFNFTTALITGGGGGIGLALAKWLQQNNKKVIIAGRTTSKLAEASTKELKNCAYYNLDTGDIASIPEFVEKVTEEHPELDCVINNAGVQRPLSIHNDGFDLTKADNEIDINIRGPLHLTIALLPHFRTKSQACIVNVSSVLGFIPFNIVNPNYNGTKAWLHFWTMNLRTQIHNEGLGGKIKVVELVPPTVATELHREREDSDDNKKEKNASALSVNEFVADVEAQWKEGRETIGAGVARGIVEKWEGAYLQDYEKLVGGG